MTGTVKGKTVAEPFASPAAEMPFKELQRRFVQRLADLQITFAEVAHPVLAFPYAGSGRNGAIFYPNVLQAMFVHLDRK